VEIEETNCVIEKRNIEKPWYVLTGVYICSAGTKLHSAPLPHLVAFA